MVFGSFWGLLFSVETDSGWVLYPRNNREFLLLRYDSRPGRLAQVSWVSLALALPAAGSLAAGPLCAYQLLCLLRMGTGLLLPLGKQENMFCQCGWSGVASLAPGPPPAGRQRAGRLLLLEWRAGSLAACFLQLSKHGEPGRKPTVRLQAPAEPLSQHGNNGLDGVVGRWRGSPSRLCFHHDRDRLLGSQQGLCSPYPPSPVLFSILLNTLLPISGAKENSGLRKCPQVAAGVLSSERQRSWGRGPEKK